MSMKWYVQALNRAWYVLNRQCALSCFGRVRLFVTTWTVACRAPLSMDSLGWNTGVGFHALLLGDLPNPGIKPSSPALQADALTSELPGKLRFSIGVGGGGIG